MDTHLLSQPDTPTDRLSAYIERHGFATAVATALIAGLLYLLAWLLPPIVRAEMGAYRVEARDLKNAVERHAHESSQRGEEARQFERRMLQFQYIGCRRASRTQADRDACDSVTR
jgi:hypothetical protein